MNRFLLRLLLVCLLVGFGIFFGVDVAMKGVERVHGPLSGQALTTGNDPARLVDNEQIYTPPSKMELPPPAYTQREEKPKVTVQPSGGVKLAEQTGKLIQTVVHGLVEWIIAIFNAFL